jgi:hypothetical protein
MLLSQPILLGHEERSVIHYLPYSEQYQASGVIKGRISYTHAYRRFFADYFIFFAITAQNFSTSHHFRDSGFNRQIFSFRRSDFARS